MSRIFRSVLIINVILVLFLAGCGKIPSSSKILPVEAAGLNAAVDNTKKVEPVYVKPGDDINEAVNKVQNGGTIVLKSGTYDIKDTVIISEMENVTIKGEGEVWVNLEGIDHHVFTVKNSKNIEFRNIKAQHVLKDGEDKKGPLEDARNGSVVGVLDCSKVTFRNCELVGCGIYGLFAQDTNEIEISGCYIHHNSLKALGFENLKSVTNVFIEGSRIVNNMDYIEKIGNINIFDKGNNIIKDNSEKGYNTK